MNKKMQRRQKAGDRDILFEGLGVSPGIAFGQIYFVEPGNLSVPDYEIPATAVDDEFARFAEAVQKSEKQLRKLKAKTLELHGMAGEELGFLLDAHIQMLSSSRLRKGIEGVIRSERRNAEAAVSQEIHLISAEFNALNDPYLAARANDVIEVGRRLIRNLTATPFHGFSNINPGTIIVAEELTPADTALLDPKKVEGFVTSLGGRESHTAIMARSLNIPAILGIPELLTVAKNGDEIIIDGQQGKAILRPGAAYLNEYKRRQAELQRNEKLLSRLKKLPAVTRDGQIVGVFGFFVV